MSPPNEPACARDILSWDESRLDALLNACRATGGGDGELDLSDVMTGVDRLSTPERDELGLKITTSLQRIPGKKLDAGELFERLAAVVERDELLDMGTPRSSTGSPPPPERNNRLEGIAYQDLVQRQGRPGLPLEYINGEVTEGQKKRQERLWVDKDYWGFKDDIAPIFSCQLEDWLEFQHKWQWDNRGKAESGEGFSEHLQAQIKHFTDMGHGSWAKKKSFEISTRGLWDHDRGQAGLVVERRPGTSLSAYIEAANQRLSNHGFLKPVKFAENPREQDPWTTWVEYLDYLYYWQDTYAWKVGKLQGRKDRSWEAFEAHGWVRGGTGPVSAETAPPEMQLRQVKAELEARTAAVHKLLKETADYRHWDSLLRRQQKRAVWARKQVALIESEEEEENTKPKTGQTGEEEEVKEKEKEKKKEEEKKEEKDEAEAGPTPTGKHKGKMKRDRSDETPQPSSKRAKTGDQQPRTPQGKETSSQLTASSPRRSRRLASKGTMSSDGQKSTSKKPRKK